MARAKPYCAVCVDVGGTNIKAGLVTSAGKIVLNESHPTHAARGKNAVIDSIASIVRGVMMRARQLGMKPSLAGIGMPGIITTGGVLVESPNFPGWKNVPLGKLLSGRLKMPVLLENDANAAALGEYAFGAARGIPNFVMLTIGTGLGGGVVLDGGIWRGPGGMAGEAGHITVEPAKTAPKCGCGNRGCLETYCSVTGISRMYRESCGASASLSVDDIRRRAEKGDRYARAAFRTAGEKLGIAIAAIANLLDVRTFVIGGGVAGAWRHIGPAAKKEILARSYKSTGKLIKLKRAKLGNNAALLFPFTTTITPPGP